MYVFVTFDIEDTVHPDADDVVRDIATMLADDGIVGTMCVVGEKARLWEQRDRRDVIAAVGQHDVGLHTNLHSVHPTASEYLADKGWAEGIAEFIRREQQGVVDLERILGQFPSTWASSGYSWGPQIASATRHLGIPSHIYSFARSGETGASRFAGQLCYDDDLWLDGVEDALCDDAAFETDLPKLIQEVRDKLRRGLSCTCLRAAHPTRLLYHDYWDELNYARGQDLTGDEYRFANRRTDAEYCAALRNLQRMILAVRDLPGVKVVPLRALNGKFTPHNSAIAWADLSRLARDVVGSADIDVKDPTASPAQKLDLFARAILTSSAGATPAYLLSRLVLGPVAVQHPLLDPVAVGRDKAIEVCRRLVSHIDATGHLPAALTVDGVTLGPGPLLRGLAGLFLASTQAAPPEEMTLKPGAEEPAIAAQLEAALYQHVPGWVIHRPDLCMDQLVLHTRLQSWSLKPAIISA